MCQPKLDPGDFFKPYKTFLRQLGSINIDLILDNIKLLLIFLDVMMVL